MKRPVKTGVTVNFNDSDSDKLEFRMEMHNFSDGPPGSVPPNYGTTPLEMFNEGLQIRVYAPIGTEITVRATKGSAQLTSQSGYKVVKYEALVFDEDSEARPEYFVSGDFQPTSLNLLFDLEGNEIQASAIYNAEKDRVILSGDEGPVKATGSIRIDYLSYYKIINYKPEYINQGPVSGNITIFGEIIAFAPGFKPKKFKPSQNVELQENNDWDEAYRVISYALVSSDDVGEDEDPYDANVWELPVGWPNNLTYSPSALGDSPDETEATQWARWYEIGYVNKFGHFTTNTNYEPNAKPYVNNSSYNPVYYFKRNNSLPTSQSSKLNWSGIENRLKAEYEGIKGFD